MNEETYLTLRDVGERSGIQVSKQSERVIQVQKRDKTFFIYNNVWPHNSAASHTLAIDKAETHLRLVERGVPSVEQIRICAQDPFPFDTAKDFFENAKGRVVIKPNFGSKGEHITFCENWGDLQRVLPQYLFVHREVNLSRRVEVINEYRCVVLDGTVQLVYLKKRPWIIGDGYSPLLSLLAQSQYKLVRLKAELAERIYNIPQKGQAIILSHQDNLSSDAQPEVINGGHVLFEELRKMSLEAASVLELRFCSVDVVLDQKGMLFVMEVNSGIMFDNFISSSSSNKKEVMRIFLHALESLEVSEGG